MHGNFLQLVESFLSHMYQRVVLNGQESSWANAKQFNSGEQHCQHFYLQHFVSVYISSNLICKSVTDIIVTNPAEWQIVFSWIAAVLPKKLQSLVFANLLTIS